MLCPPRLSEQVQRTWTYRHLSMPLGIQWSMANAAGERCCWTELPGVNMASQGNAQADVTHIRPRTYKSSQATSSKLTIVCGSVHQLLDNGHFLAVDGHCCW